VASTAVADAEARLAGLRADAGSARARWVGVEAEARRLAQRADPDRGRTIAERWDQRELVELDRILGAVDTWTGWAAGRPVDTGDLDNAVAVLSEAAGRAPQVSLTGEPDLAAWARALTPLAGSLGVNHSIDVRAHDACEGDRSDPAIDLGL
jgi:hypothetical protein